MSFVTEFGRRIASKAARVPTYQAAGSSLDDVLGAVSDVARLRSLQATRTPAGIDQALQVSREALGSSLIGHSRALVSSAPSGQHAATSVAMLWGSAGVAGVRSVVAKAASARPRPYAMNIGVTSAAPAAVRGSSFPSTHAAISHAASTVVAARGVTPHADEAVKFAEQVSHSRMYLGVHFPSDVVAGEQIGSRTAERVMGWLSRAH